MVRKGFALFDIKRLYIDEFKQYHDELVYSLEMSGEIQEGTYDKIKGIDRSSENLASLFKKAKKA